MLGKSLLVLCVCVYVVLGEECSTYSGPRCQEPNQQTMLNTANCTRRCVEVYPLYDCDKICDRFEGPNCTRKQYTVLNHCSCTTRCVDILGEGNKCDDKGDSMCGKSLNCVDGVCKP